MVSLEIGYTDPFHFVLFSQNFILIIPVALFFHMNFRIILSISIKDRSGREGAACSLFPGQPREKARCLVLQLRRPSLRGAMVLAKVSQLMRRGTGKAETRWACSRSFPLCPSPVFPFHSSVFPSFICWLKREGSHHRVRRASTHGLGRERPGSSGSNSSPECWVRRAPKPVLWGGLRKPLLLPTRAAWAG